MPGEEDGHLPRNGPQECRARAEELLAVGDASTADPHAIGWALLAIAGELHEIRTLLRRRK